MSEPILPTLRQQFFQHVAQTSDAPMGLAIERAEGVYLFDTDGKKYLDLIAGISVSVLGHRYPAVVEAAKAQLGKYLHTLVYGEFVLAPQVRLATLLVVQLPAPLDSVYFVNSGTEAVEGAMKLAKRVTSRTQFIAMRRAYHGSTQGAMSLNNDDYFTQAFRPLLPDIQHIEFDCVWCLRQITARTAAVVVETVPAESGVRPPSLGYLRALRERCTEVGALLILDEIQVGMGRTGTLFAFEQYGIAPDILLLAKGLGGGMPLGAFIASRQMMQMLTDAPVLGHITTFGGHPVSCAAALATLETLLSTDYITRVKEKEALFCSLLVHRRILAVRSAGLLMAVELASFAEVQAVIKAMLAKGVITDWFLFNSKSLRIAPPLIISEAEIRWACAMLLESLEDLD